ncbi:MAG: phosphodiesterase [Desulfobacterales bacterium SG8_35]|nr:MAG: phosphodiesterase [Desulfobacterales bacterium SG8_35]
MITIGVLSDTHLLEPDKWFRERARRCFADADMILHAGDLTSLSVLEVFAGKTVHAVHGNMCGPKTRNTLPASKIIEVGNFRLALVHGAGYMHNIEQRLFDLFAPIDCIVYGHTHKAVCHRFGPTLMVNPGSFTATGPYGASGTYASIKVDRRSMEGRIHLVGNAA